MMNNISHTLRTLIYIAFVKPIVIPVLKGINAVLRRIVGIVGEWTSDD